MATTVFFVLTPKRNFLKEFHLVSQHMYNISTKLPNLSNFLIQISVTQCPPSIPALRTVWCPEAFWWSTFYSHQYEKLFTAQNVAVYKMKAICMLLPFLSDLLLCLLLRQLIRDLPGSNNIHIQWASENPRRLNITWSNSPKRSRDIKISATRLGLIIANPLLGWSESDLHRALFFF